ncbi:MAG: Unknown protein [uncultured Sulfurovum sp.]|uniref:DUF302 domain-containing protein n=1 Tax=uncultured Sulfurovum sp. TaxID=269237 RepID=A0A6S6TPK3_9BACT|nr:MAG: Unknown protein [uncultured Sulfurovum sp.]
MRLNIFPKLLGIIILTMTLASTSTLTELQGTKNLSETDLKRMVKQLESIKFKTIFKNERVDTKYYKKYKEKNLELLNFYTVTDLETMHELLIENPDFALYAPFTFLAYQHLEKEKDNNITWYGHLMTDTMLDIIGEKDKILQEKFKVMVAKLDSLVAQELKPTEVKKMTFDKPLPKEPIFKMVKDISNVDDIEGFVEEFIMEYDSLFVENHFLLAGVADFKMEYEDLDLEFEKYDAFWVSPICHLEFTNTIFNRAIPQAGVLAPCTVYFYVPKGSGKLYVGYVPLEHWISMADINNEAQITAIKKTSADMIQVFKELGFKMNIEVAKAEVKKVEAVAVKATEVKEEIEKAKAGESVLVEFYGTKGQPDAELGAMIDNLGKIGFNTSAKNEHIENHYYNKFKEKNLDLLSFYTLFDIESLRPLLLKNPDFGAYAPFNLLAYKKLKDAEGGDTTWYGHLNVETMLKIIGESDEETKEKFRVMMSKVDKHVEAEMKPTERKTLSYSAALPEKPLLKMVKKIGEVEDIEEYVEEFIPKHNLLFKNNKFIIAGFLDVKFEYEDLELEFDKYDAYWVSSLCHFEFSNAVFNQGDPHAGAFAPCSVYFYIPKGSGEIHVGYASVDNWLATTGITDPKKIAYMKEISASVIRIFKELGFEMKEELEVKQKEKAEVKAEVKKVEVVAVKATEVKEEIEKAKAGESVLVEFYGTKGQPDAELGAMIDNLGKIGFNTSAKNEHIENHYYNKFKEKNLDLLSFYTLFDIESLRPLLLKNPDFGAYAPFNLLAYKKLKDAEGGDTTWYGHLNVETMLKIIGESDEETKEKFRVMMSKVDKHVEAEMKPTERKTLSYSAALPEKPLLKMVKKIGEVEDIEEYVEEFIPKHNLLFKNNKFIIAGFLDVKFEYEDLELEFDKYDAYWVSSLCHFEFSNAVFNQGDPHAGAFAPCSVYFYIPKGSGEIHVGYASVDNWLATTGITDPKKIAYMKEISASVIRIFKELGFEMKEELEVKQKEKAEVEKAEAVAVKATEVKETANTIKIVIPTVPKVNVAIPEPVTVAIGVEKEDISERGLDDRRIQYESRIPPGYMTSEERYKQNTKKASVMVGEVDKGRISTYLRTGLISIDEAKAKLEKAGFQIITVVSLDKKKQLTSIVFTSDALKKMSSKENRGHLATLRLLINEKDKRVSITNPLYLAKAFLENEFVKEDAVKILTSIVSEFKGIQNSSDKLKFQLLPKYQFMNNLPYFKDHIVVARGDNLKAKLVNNKRVAFSLDLANGATLIGVKLNKRTQKFPKQIGLDNAGMLPYPLLIENGEAKILNPKYYISLMYPKLTMEEFMTIATVPDGIENDCAKVFR